MNKKHVVLLLTMLFLALSFLVIYYKSTTTQIQLDKEIHDYGDVKVGERIKAVFKIKNIGLNNLKISNITADCNCTVAEWNTNPVKPNDETLIVVYFDNLVSGYFQQKVVLESNAVNSPLLLLIRGRAL